METTIEQSKLDIVEKLLKQPKSFNFYQAIRLIGHLLNYDEKHGLKGRLDIVPWLSLAFSGTDIRDIKWDEEDNRFTLTASFFSLYGTTSPLPTFYTEQLIQDDNDDHIEVKALLDIFHQRLYSLLFLAWSKSRIYEQFAEYQDAFYQKVLYGYIGMSEEDVRKKIPNYQQLLKYASHWVSDSKSVWSLRDFLTDYFKVPFHVFSFLRAIKPIPEEQYCLLGKDNHQLSKTSYLGSQFKSNSNSLLIQIGPLSAEVFPHFLSKMANIERLKLLLQLYIKQPFCFLIEVILDKGCFKPIHLTSETTSSLGVASWLAPQKDIDMFKIRYWLET